MKYKIGDKFLIPFEITAIDGDRTAPYYLSGCASAGWWSEMALGDIEHSTKPPANCYVDDRGICGNCE